MLLVCSIWSILLFNLETSVVMEENNIKLNDISKDLLILNKPTIDNLFKLDNCVDCIALYIFYYKTAKWQDTSMIKATDEYVKKSLKWGRDKIQKTKATLKEKGLIDIVQKRKNGKIDGWYIQVNYLITNKKQEEIKIKVDNSKNSQNQQVLKPTSGSQDTNAYIKYIKCLLNKIEMLNKEIDNNKLLSKESSKSKKDFVPPTIEEVREYCIEKGYNIDVDKFYEYYDVADWKDSKGSKVKNWKQRVITWNSKTPNNIQQQKTTRKIADYAN